MIPALGAIMPRTSPGGGSDAAATKVSTSRASAAPVAGYHEPAGLHATIPRMSADFTRADVERIARLARLELTEEEKILITPQLSSFLAYAEQVQQVATAGVPPTSHPFGATGSWRDDIAQPSLPRDAALSQAPEADVGRGLLKVPRVLG